MVVGHRGCRQFPGIPENSLEAFKYAIERGATGLELDCRLTKDGEVVVIHDDKVWRLTTSQTGSVSEMTLKEVQALSYRMETSHPNSPSLSTSCIPTLKEVLLLAKEHNVKVFVEIKCIDISSAPVIAQKVCALFTELEAHAWACVIAFNPLVLYHVRRFDPKIECCMLYDDCFFHSAATANLETVSPIITYAHKLLDPLLHYAAKNILPEFIGCTMVGPYFRMVSPIDVARFKARGLSTYVWVPNTSIDSKFYLSMNCSIGTDCIFPKPCSRGLESTQVGVSVSDD